MNTVDWQLSCSEMKQRGAHLLHSGQWSDCTFLVGAESNQITVRGHKLILAMSSPVFEAMFFGGMAERNEPISILDVQPEAFKALLEYIYTDNINISSFDKACELCYGAKKYMLPHLVKECTKYLWSDLYPRNACRAYEFAKLFEESVLMDKCMQIICTNTKEVLSDNSFEDVDLQTIITVFSLDYLNIESELDLFNAAVRYAKSRNRNFSEKSSITASSSPSTSKEETVATSEVDKTSSLQSNENTGQATSVPSPLSNPENRTPSIRNALEKIRFLTLTPQQFAEGPARSTLLTESESFAVLMNILSTNTDVSMPRDFSVSREPRKQLTNTTTSTSSTMTFTNTTANVNVDTPSPVHVTSEPCSSRVVRTCGNTISSNNILSSLQPMSMMSQEREHHDFSKIYCQRHILQHTDCLNTSMLDCSVTFMVDKNICLLGVQVPTQVLSEENTTGAASCYSELLYAHLLDGDGSRLTYTHYTSRVPYRCLLDIIFNRPVYIQRNKVYKVDIVFNKVGWYPMGTCSQQVIADTVRFDFGIGQTSDSVRDGLVRSIIFTY